jgi:hypothetical protein
MLETAKEHLQSVLCSFMAKSNDRQQTIDGFNQHQLPKSLASQMSGDEASEAPPQQPMQPREISNLTERSEISEDPVKSSALTLALPQQPVNSVRNSWHPKSPPPWSSVTAMSFPRSAPETPPSELERHLQTRLEAFEKVVTAIDNRTEVLEAEALRTMQIDRIVVTLGYLAGSTVETSGNVSAKIQPISPQFCAAPYMLAGKSYEQDAAQCRATKRIRTSTIESQQLLSSVRAECAAATVRYQQMQLDVVEEFGLPLVTCAIGQAPPLHIRALYRGVTYSFGKARGGWVGALAEMRVRFKVEAAKYGLEGTRKVGVGELLDAWVTSVHGVFGAKIVVQAGIEHRDMASKSDEQDQGNV